MNFINFIPKYSANWERNACFCKTTQSIDRLLDCSPGKELIWLIQLTKREVFWFFCRGIAFQVCFFRKSSTSDVSSESTECRQNPRLENSSMGNSGSKPSLMPSEGNMKSSMAWLCSVYIVIVILRLRGFHV